MKESFRKPLFLLLVIAVSTVSAVMAQQEGFIYGEITLKNNKRYTGKIYWSAGQRMWMDMLIVEKKDNPVLDYLDNDELKKLSEEEEKKDMDWGFMNLWKNHYPSRKLTLRCRFGDIALIKISGSRKAAIVLKNGKRLDVYIDDDREYHDQLGEEIAVLTSEKDRVKLDWDDIAQIRFMKTPSRLPQFNGVPLYGTVSTRLGLSYTGFVQWDGDEHYSANYVDGETKNDKDIRLRFRDIYSIRPKDEGALVKLHSGKEVYLRGSRDVNRSNRGIVVRHPDWGQVVIRWKDFKGVTFSAYPDNASIGYDDFGRPSPLRGTVQTRDGKSWRGELVYELDEELDIETLDGRDEAGAFHQVPFRYIKKIYPINDEHTAAILKNEDILVLGGSSDVTKKNWGVMVWLPREKFKYIPWDQVRSVELD